MVKYHSLAAKFQSPIAVTPKNIELNNPTNIIYYCIGTQGILQLTAWGYTQMSYNLGLYLDILQSRLLRYVRVFCNSQSKTYTSQSVEPAKSS